MTCGEGLTSFPGLAKNLQLTLDLRFDKVVGESEFPVGVGAFDIVEEDLSALLSELGELIFLNAILKEHRVEGDFRGRKTGDALERLKKERRLPGLITKIIDVVGEVTASEPLLDRSPEKNRITSFLSGKEGRSEMVKLAWTLKEKLGHANGINELAGFTRGDISENLVQHSIGGSSRHVGPGGIGGMVRRSALGNWNKVVVTGEKRLKFRRCAVLVLTRGKGERGFDRNP
jgi:hypothetical protein